MSKSIQSGSAAALALVSVSTVFASYTETFQLGDWWFPQHQPGIVDDIYYNIGYTHDPNPKPVVGIRVTFNYTEVDAFGAPALDGSQASDLGLVFAMGGGMKVGFGGSNGNLGAIAGGYTMADALTVANFYSVWNFDGAASDLPGLYTHEFYFATPLQKPGDVFYWLTDTGNGNTAFTNLTVELIKVPSPSALVLFGVASVVGTRRRRG